MSAQTTPSKETLSADLETIKQTVLGYIEAWYKGEPERGKRVFTRNWPSGSFASIPKTERIIWNR